MGNHKINKIKTHIENTESNCRDTEKIINQVKDEDLKTELQIKNLLREQSLRNMKQNINDEYDKENNLK